MAEQLFYIAATLISCAIFGYTMNTVGLILMERNAKIKKYKDERQLMI